MASATTDVTDVDANSAKASACRAGNEAAAAQACANKALPASVPPVNTENSKGKPAYDTDRVAESVSELSTSINIMTTSAVTIDAATNGAAAASISGCTTVMQSTATTDAGHGAENVNHSSNDSAEKRSSDCTTFARCSSGNSCEAIDATRTAAVADLSAHHAVLASAAASGAGPMQLNFSSGTNSGPLSPSVPARLRPILPSARSSLSGRVFSS
eukprot:6194205-Pleurochrysis_carterae.AAC.1